MVTAKIHVTTSDGELLGTIEVNEHRVGQLTDPSGVSNLSKALLAQDVGDLLHIIIARREARKE